MTRTAIAERIGAYNKAADTEARESGHLSDASKCIGVVLARRAFEREVTRRAARAVSGELLDLSQLTAACHLFDALVQDRGCNVSAEVRTIMYEPVHIGERKLRTVDGRRQPREVFVQPVRAGIEGTLEFRRELWVVAPDDGADLPYTVDNSYVVSIDQAEYGPDYSDAKCVASFAKLLEGTISYIPVEAPVPVPIG